MFLLVDWGTTSFRLFLLDSQGKLLGKFASDQGVAKIKRSDQPAYLLGQVKQLGGDPSQSPVIVCGMAGSNMGLYETGYVSCPVNAGDLASSLSEINLPGLSKVYLVPGVRFEEAERQDVMRGEETQVLGWLGEDKDRLSGRHYLCLPGTHCKWVILDNGKVVDFETAMTGELYALLSEHSSLLPGSSGNDSSAEFLHGVSESKNGVGLPQMLFGCRSKVLLQKMAPENAESYLSGLLIGSEVIAYTRRGWNNIHIVGNQKLSARYAQALREYGVDSVCHSGDDLVVSGLMQIARFSTFGLF